MSSINHSIGRKVWLWVSTGEGGPAVMHSKQALDASIAYVHADGTVNLSFFDHLGNSGTVTCAPLYDPKETDQHMGGGSAYATWMPFQVKTAAAADPPAETRTLHIPTQEYAEPTALELGAAARAAGPEEKY